LTCKRCFYYLKPKNEAVCRQCTRNTTGSDFAWLIVVFIAYLAVARFSHYLFSGMFFSGRDEFGYYYRHIFSGFHNLKYPIDIAVWKSHALMLGLIFAFLSVIPLAASLLYGAWAGVLLALLGSALSPFAYFSVAGAIGAMITGSEWTRIPNKYISVLLGLIPSILFFGFYFIPINYSAAGFVYILPYVVFLLSSVLACLLIVYSAKHRSWRATAVVVAAPLCCGIFILWLIVGVGIDRLEYVVLSNKMSITGTIFNPHINRDRIIKDDDAGPAPLNSSTYVSSDTQLKSILKIQQYFNLTRDYALKAFLGFADNHSTSDLCPLALYNIADLVNAKLDINSLKERGTFIIYTDRIEAESLKSYNLIRKNHHSSPVTILAYLKTADYYYQQGDFATAVMTYRELISQFESKIPKTYDPPYGLSVETIVLNMGAQTLKSQDDNYYLLDYCCRNARQMLNLIENNNDFDGEPLRKFAGLDKHSRNYSAELKRILSDKAYEATLLTDNLRLALLTHSPSPDVDQLRKLQIQITNTKGASTSDIIDRLLFHLAEAYCLGAFDKREWIETARRLYRRIIIDYPDSIYYVHCKARLVELDKQLESGMPESLLE